MDIYVFEGIGNIASIINDGTTLTEEDKYRALKLDRLPEKIDGVNNQVLKADINTGEVWYEEMPENRNGIGLKSVVELPTLEEQIYAENLYQTALLEMQMLGGSD